MKKIIIAVMLFTGLFAMADSGLAEEISFLGEFCWSLNKTEDEHGATDETYVIKVAVTHTAGTNYILQGILELVDDNPFIFFGTATIVDNEIFMTMNGSQDHSPGTWRDTGNIHVRLDVRTFNGTFWSNRLDYNTSTRIFEHGFSAGTATLLNCP